METSINKVNPIDLTKFDLVNPVTKELVTSYLVCYGNSMESLVDYYNINQRSFITVDSVGNHYLVNGDDTTLLTKNHLEILEKDIGKHYNSSDFYMDVDVSDFIDWGDIDIKYIVKIADKQELDRKLAALSKIESIVNRSDPDFSYKDIYIHDKPKDYIAAKTWLREIDPNYHFVTYVINGEHEILLEVTRSLAPSQLDTESQFNDMVVKITNLDTGIYKHDGLINSLNYDIKSLNRSIIELTHCVI